MRKEEKVICFMELNDVIRMCSFIINNHLLFFFLFFVWIFLFTTKHYNFPSIHKWDFLGHFLTSSSPMLKSVCSIIKLDSNLINFYLEWRCIIGIYSLCPLFLFLHRIRGMKLWNFDYHKRSHCLLVHSCIWEMLKGVERDA